MAYRCVHCLSIFKDDAKEVSEGCMCGGKFFFYITEEKLKLILETKDNGPDLTEAEKEQIEEDVREISGVVNDTTPVFLDFESVAVIKPGKYLLDLQKLLAINAPRVYRLEDGKYIIDLTAKTRAGATIKKTM